MVVGGGGAELVDPGRHGLGRLELRRAVQHQELVEGAVDGSFGARAVVAEDVEDEGVIEDPEVLERVDEPADVMVGVLEEPGVDLHLSGEHRLQRVVHVGPSGDLVGTRRQLGIGGHDTQFLLPGQRRLAEGVPAVVESAAVPVGPVGGHVVGGVGGARRVVDEERLVGHQRLLLANPGDRLVGHVLGEVVPLLGGLRRVEGRRALVDGRVVLVGLTADEPVEVLEPTVGGPLPERAHRARLPHGHLVALTELRGRVAVELEDLGQRCRGQRPHRRVAGRRSGKLGDGAHAHGVVVATGQERLARGRAQRGGVQTVELQPASGEPLGVGRGARPAEHTAGAEAAVVHEDDQHVRRARRGVAGG